MENSRSVDGERPLETSQPAACAHHLSYVIGHHQKVFWQSALVAVRSSLASFTSHLAQNLLIGLCCLNVLRFMLAWSSEAPSGLELCYFCSLLTVFWGYLQIRRSRGLLIMSHQIHFRKEEREAFLSCQGAAW